MLTGVKILVTAALGVGLGLAATNAAVQDGLSFDSVHAGPWSSSAAAGSSKADPYVKAALAREAAIPLGLAEGLSFIASHDSSAQRLSGRCVYVVRGAVPPARYWTISVLTLHGRPIGNAAERYGFTSAEIVRSENGAFRVVISREARPGNWLPIGTKGPFLLMFRLYDTPVTSTVSTLDAHSMPSVTRTGCG